MTKRTPAKRPNPWFRLRRSRIQGTGAFAIVDIPKGTRLVEYVGEHITPAEADRRYPDDDTGTRHHTFLFTLNQRVVIDAAHDGNEARFINHSCDPNCDAIIERGHIWIYAIKPIPKGTELAYDYQFEHLPEYTEEDLALYQCRCGSAKCRGTIVKIDRRRKIARRWEARQRGEPHPHHAASRHAHHKRPRS
jgi:SET domain-containing protein